MIEELQLRNYSPNTIAVYIRCVANFAQHFKLSPDQLGPEHIREYQLLLVQRKKVAWAVFNQTVCALRFFYHHILHRDWMIEHIPYPRHEDKLPVVLSPAEVAAVFNATPNLKHRTILMTIYAGGLRVSEVTHLRVSDIDSQRQVICVHQGKAARIAR
jgi:site-specific recombinase XerD